MTPVTSHGLHPSTLPRLLEIDRASYGPLAWTEDDYWRTMRHKSCVEGRALNYLGAGTLAAFVIYGHREEGAQILRLAVAPDCRRQGCGAFLLSELVTRVGPQGRLYCPLPECNLPGQLFLRATGFRATGTRRGAYPGDMAAILFEWRPYWLPPATVGGQQVNRVAAYDGRRR